MKNINTEKQLGMAWYKFLIYFALFAGAVLNFIYGVNYLSGGIYYSQTNGQITSEIVYAYYGEVLKFLDIVMGFSLIALSVFGLILRQKLVKYSLDAPKLAYVFYSLSFGLGCIYSLLVSAIIAKPIGVSEVCSLVINGVFGVFNIQYFRKRAHLFVGINPSVCHSEPVSRLKTEEHPEENLFSDNTVRINLSPAGQKQKIEVSEYHIYGSDVKLDKDVQFENSCSIAEQSNYTYDSIYNPFAEKNSSSSVKQKYCFRCGCLIDNETKKCTGCGKQYLKNIWMTVIVFSILAVLIGSVVLISTRDYRENDNLGGYNTDANFQSSSQPDYKILGLTYDQYKLASIVATYDVNEYCNHIADLKNMVEMSTYREELKKEKVIEYINNNNTLDYGEKIILYRILFSADNEYNSDIVDYLNGRDDVTYDEMVFVLEELGFAVFEDGKVKW